MGIEVRDERFFDVVEENLELETLADGFAFTEGPIWHPREQHLTFSDIPYNRMLVGANRSGFLSTANPAT